MRVRPQLDLLLSVIHRYTWLITDDRLEYEIDEDADTLYVVGELTFADDSRLSFSEGVLPGVRRYRYYYGTAEGTLIFRYDNAPHHPQLASFPHHKHEPMGVAEAEERRLNEILVEVEDLILTVEDQ